MDDQDDVRQRKHEGLLNLVNEGFLKPGVDETINGIELTSYALVEHGPDSDVNAIARSIIPRPIDNTALNEYMTCPRKYFYGMVLNRRRSGPPSPAIAFGSAWHKALETHYKGGDREAVEYAVMSSWQDHGKLDDHRTWGRVMSCFDQYITNYGDYEHERAVYGETVGFADGMPMIEIPVELVLPGATHPYVGKIDRIVQWQGLYYIEDHKTTSAMGPYYFEQFNPSNQMMGYVALAKGLTGLPIAGVRINALGVLKTQTKFARQIISYSADRLEQWIANYKSWTDRLANSYSWYSSSDSEDIQLEAWPHNFNACAGKYGMCQYTGVCSQPVPLRRRVLEMDFEELPWNPLESEEGASE